jgi:hypothetical protein
MNRQIRRAAGREQSKIHHEFWTVVNTFHQYTETAETESYLAKRFNAIWIQFCDHWEKSPHLMKPDRRAFLNYVTGKSEPVIQAE